MKRILSLALHLSICLLLYSSAYAQTVVTFASDNKTFPLVTGGKAAPLFISDTDEAGVKKIANLFSEDIQRVTGILPQLSTSSPKGRDVVIIGTLGRNKQLDRLVQSKKIDVSHISGKWEHYLIQVVNKPMPGVTRALVIAGSDKRGTLFGMLELSAQMGVSPWYWWADVPVQKHADVFIKDTPFVDGPKVKYRGIFINDEAPALSGWVQENFGAFNARFYDHVFQLILRLKGNFLWPAMWGRSIYDDDPQSPILANEYGIVISTSHHEPMMRAHVEWQRYGKGEWNYEKNEAYLKNFWREGIKRMGTHESIVTLAMRGDGDMAMSRETNTALLEKIVSDQRDIIKEVTGKEITQVPQVWALYKEVQDYYDQGMRVPDDVTLLLCDDNWGNIRKLPKPGDKPRAGGYGIYYHYDYVGGPRNYKWINTNQIERVWEQMHLAYEHGVDRIWVVNVGDIKPMELPIDFFLDYAWDPDRISAEQLPAWYEQWSQQQFGSDHAKDIASLLKGYTRFNSRRKPELLSADTYSLINFRESERIVNEYNALASDAEKLLNTLSSEYHDAFFQLVYHPVVASANLNEMYRATALNRFYAKQGRVFANVHSKKVSELFERDAALTKQYHQLGNGKWNHMMDQTHISYTYWQQPPKDVVPEVSTVTPVEKSEMGLALEANDQWWPQSNKPATTPTLDPNHHTATYIEIFNRGSRPFDFKITSDQPWVKLSKSSGTITDQETIDVTIDWSQAPRGTSAAVLTIEGAGVAIPVHCAIHTASKGTGFQISNGLISIEAEHFTSAHANAPTRWQIVPGLGRTLSGVTLLPTTAPEQTLTTNSAHLEYAFTIDSAGTYAVTTYLSPTLNYYNNEGLRFAVSIDDEQPQVINMHTDPSMRTWERWVANNVVTLTSTHGIASAGTHTLKFWVVDPGVVLQKIVVHRDGLPHSYLGPPESYQVK